METLLTSGKWETCGARSGKHEETSVTDGYLSRMLSFVDTGKIKPATVVVNAGNGCAGPVFDQLAKHLPLEIVRLHHQPDGRFPNGVPNPLLPENRRETAQAVGDTGAALGIAWAGDVDGCLFFDGAGGLVGGC